MRLPAPRVIAIDDELEHLEGLTRGLNQYGAACLPVHFTGELDIAPCSQVRVIFADLHLSGGPLKEDHAQDFSIIGGLIEDTIRPAGPYFIVLWTMYPEQAESLQDFLTDRLQNVAKPITVQALNKKDHPVDEHGDVRNSGELVEAIGKIVEDQPQIRALLNWEERVLGATAETVSSIVEMAESAASGADPGVEVGRLLRCLAVQAAGSKHVEEDRFRAVNDALLPILADRIANMCSLETDDEVWRAALGEADVKPELTGNEVAKLNRLLHIAPSNPDGNGDGEERGAVIALPEEFSGKAFAETFDLPSKKAMEDQFRCKWPEEDDELVRWVLVQTQAACDYAQSQPGPLPFHLGLCLPMSRAIKNSPPAALWRSPSFEYENQVYALHVNARFPVSLPKKKVGRSALVFRLREQLLNDLVYQLHGYDSRPGIISFRPPKTKK